MQKVFVYYKISEVVYHAVIDADAIRVIRDSNGKKTYQAHDSDSFSESWSNFLRSENRKIKIPSMETLEWGEPVVVARYVVTETTSKEVKL